MADAIEAAEKFPVVGKRFKGISASEEDRHRLRQMETMSQGRAGGNDRQRNISPGRMKATCSSEETTTWKATQDNTAEKGAAKTRREVSSISSVKLEERNYFFPMGRNPEKTMVFSLHGRNMPTLAGARAVSSDHTDLSDELKPVYLKSTGRPRKLPPLERNLEKKRREKLPSEEISLTQLDRRPLPSIEPGRTVEETNIGGRMETDVRRRVGPRDDLEAEPGEGKRDICDSLLKLCACCSQDLRDKLRDRRCRIVVIATIIALLIIVAIILLPVSMVRLEHYELGLKIRRHAQSYYAKPTYYPGSYMLGPNWEFIKFPYNSIMMHYEDLGVFTVSRLVVSFGVSFQYQLRPEEIGDLYKKFGDRYRRVFERISRSTLRNTIATFSVEQMRFNRTLIERSSHLALHRKLGGTCCMLCCRRNSCSGDTNYLCSGCDRSKESCDPGFHVEVRHFQLGRLKLPEVISERLLTRVIISEEIELESLNREVVLVKAETQRQVEEISNSANEIAGNGSAVANLKTNFAHAAEDQILQNATLLGWSGMTSQLNVTREDQQLSVLWINSLEKMDNLVAGSDYGAYSRVADLG